MRCPAFIGLSGNDEIVPSDTLKVYIEDFLERHHAEEHGRHERMLAHRQQQQEQQQQDAAAAPLPDGNGTGSGGGGAGGGGNPTTTYVFDDAVAGGVSSAAPYCNHDPACACPLGKGGKGCLWQRIQFAYWPRWSHGEILFRLPTLYALDKQLRDQERFFRTREVEDTMTASMRPLPRGLSRKLDHHNGNGNGNGNGHGLSRRPVSMPAPALRQAMLLGKGPAAGVGLDGSEQQSRYQGPPPGTPSGGLDGDVGVGVDGSGGIGRGVTWHGMPPEGEASIKKLV